MLAPGQMGCSEWREFEARYVTPMRQGQRADADDQTVKEGRRAQDRLQKALAGVMLRRTKALIAHQLPRKIDNIVYCQLSSLQVRAYLRALHSPDLQLLVRWDQPCDCGSGSSRARCCHRQALPEQGGVMWPYYHLCECDDVYDSVTNPKGCKKHKAEGCPEHGRNPGCPACLMLPALTLLRKISNHLDLLKIEPPRVHRMTERERFYQEDLIQMVLGEDVHDAGGSYLGGNFLSAVTDAARCGKLAALEGLLSQWRSRC